MTIENIKSGQSFYQTIKTAFAIHMMFKVLSFLEKCFFIQCYDGGNDFTGDEVSEKKYKSKITVRGIHFLSKARNI